MKELNAYLKKHGLNARHIAQEMKISVQSVYFWTNGVQKPSIENAILLEEITNGAVSVYAWKK